MYINTDLINQELGLNINALKDMSLRDVLLKEKEASYIKKSREVEENAVSEEFAELVKKYFTPMEFLKRWWAEDEIVQAVAAKMTKNSLISESFLPVGKKCHLNPCEYVRTSFETVPRYTKEGEELLHGERKKCDVYMVRNPYQGLRHGAVILELLYKRYPELVKYKFDAYEMYEDNQHPYEIYPSFHVYVPFEALMEGNIDKIKRRNVEYARSFNNGFFTPKAMEARLKEPDVEEMFQTICELKRNA